MLLSTFLIFLVYSSFNNNHYIYINRLNILLIIFSLFIFINSFNIIPLTNGVTLFNNLFYITAYHVPIIILIYITVVALLFYNTTLHGYQINSKYFSVIILLNVIALLMFPLTNDLMSIYIIIELQSYSLYILTGLSNRSYNGTRAGLLYFLIGGVASSIILLAAGNIYEETGSTNLTDINLYYYYSDSYNYCNILLIALLFKMGMAPLHKWSISVYNYAPTYITSYISIVAKISIVAFIYINATIFDNYMLILFFYISIIIAAFKPLFQVNIKIIFAYSGLLNFGYILLSIIVMDISFYIYLIQYSLTHIIIFLCLLGINQFIDKPVNEWSPVLYIQQLNISNKTLIIILTITLFSLIGIPPLPGFYGKYFIIIDAIDKNYIYEVIMIIIFSVISTYYYANIIKILIQPAGRDFSAKRGVSMLKYPLLNKGNFNTRVMNSSTALIISITFSLLISFYWLLPSLLECIYLIII